MKATASKTCCSIGLLFALTALHAACDSDSTARTCEEGTTQPCWCSATDEGTQTCVDGGERWDTCVCGEPDGDADGDVDGDVDGDADGDVDGDADSDADGELLCTPGEWRECDCDYGPECGVIGSERCAEDGMSWGDCQCEEIICEPFSTRSCTCSDGREGTEQCGECGFEWRECTCEGGEDLPLGASCVTSDQCASGLCMFDMCTRTCTDHCECPAWFWCGERTGVCEGGPTTTSVNPCSTCVADCTDRECGRGGCEHTALDSCGTCPGIMVCSTRGSCYSPG